MRNKWLSILITTALLLGMLYTSFKDDRIYRQKEASSSGNGAFSAIDEDDTIVIWYTDENLKEYINTCALSYQADHDGIKIKPVLVSGVEYLEHINTASVYEGETDKDGNIYEAPDLYITTHDNLMKAHLSGLASEASDPHEVIIRDNFPTTSLNAISCKDAYVAYPLYYETNYLLYNKTYMQNLASEKIEAEADRLEGEAAQEAIDNGLVDPEDKTDEESSKNKSGEEELTENDTGEESTENDTGEEDSLEGDFDEDDTPMGEEDVVTDPEVLRKLSTMIPSTIDDIKTFANNYDAPKEVEAVFKWDVSDIFYNYFFVGNYMNVGGEKGDDNSVLNIYNKQATECLQVYQDLNNFFSIDADEVTYDSILQEFIDGKTVFTVATTDAVSKIEEAKLNGDFSYEYGVSVLPDVSKLLKARGMSVTTCVVVNGYSDKKAEANDFASYLSFDKSKELYRMSGKIACRRGVEYDNNEIYNISAEYEKSVSVPKMIETGNFWVQLEITFTNVWNGADPDESLKALSDTIGAQIDEIDYHIPTQESVGAGALSE